MCKRYRVLFADADNTLFDFTRAEAHSLTLTMRQFGLCPDDAMRARYSAINDRLWKAFERGETTQPALRLERFRMLLAAYGLSLPPEPIAQAYTTHLGECAFLLPDALACVQRWSAHVPVYLVTNGLSDVQRSRLARSPLKPFIRDIVVSQDVGAAKPDPRMFLAALERAGNPDPRDVLMLGDSLSSDICGANNAGIDSCYLNPANAENTSGVQPTYEIHALREADALLLPASEV